ncbi:hypothetical protein NUM3379_13150 [Kineococcus sp. NUM-3379]
MPTPPAARPAAPGPPGATPGRRSVLRLGGAAALGLLLPACGVRWAPRPDPTPTAEPGPDDLAREEAVADARALELALTALAPAGGAPAAPAATALEETRAHLRALGAGPAAAPAGPGGTPGPADPTPADPPPSTPAGVVGALGAAAGRALTTAEEASAGTARLLVSISVARTLQARALAAAAGLPPPAEPASAPASGPAAPAGAPAAPLPREAVEAAQRALAGEHAAVHAFGLVAGRLTPERRAAALAAMDAHRGARGRLQQVLVAASATPAPAEPGYDVAAVTPEEATALAAQVELRLAARYADLAAADPALRREGAAGVLRATTAAASWGAPSTTPFPGLPDLHGR